jgi:hypothetical protein
MHDAAQALRLTNSSSTASIPRSRCSSDLGQPRTSPMAITTSTGWKSSCSQGREKIRDRKPCPGRLRCGTARDHRITPDLLLRAYASGLFPMADSADDPEFSGSNRSSAACCRSMRSTCPRRLARTKLRQAPFEIRFNTAFDQVVAACAESVENRPSTWINQRLQTFTAAAPAQPRPFGGGLAGRQAGGRALRGHVAACLLRRKHVQPRHRCLENLPGPSGRETA